MQIPFRVFGQPGGPGLSRRRMIAGTVPVVLGASGLLAAACGASTSAPASSSSGSSATTGNAPKAATNAPAAPTQNAQPAKKERTQVATVRFMPLGTNPWMIEQLDRYNKEIGSQAKISLQAEPQPDQATLWSKFQATVAAGDPPDLARLKEIWVFEAASKGGMRALDDYFKTDKEFNAADLLSLYQDNFKYKGQNYAVAREVSIVVGYYNKSNFEAAGLDPEKPPKTYEEFRDYARRLTKAGATPESSQWGFDVYEWSTREFLLLWLFLHQRRFGAEFWNKDKSGVELNTPTHIEVMQLFMDLAQKDRSAIPPGVKVDGGRFNGHISMWEQGTWDIPLLPTKYPELKFGVFPWPKKANQEHTALSGSTAMSKATKDPDAAWEFTKWWNSEENQLGWYLNAGGNAPARKSMYQKPPISDNPTWKPLLELITVGNSPPRPMCERYTELAETMTPALMKGFKGEVTAKDALDEATRLGSAFWKDMGGSAAKAL